MEIGFSFCDEIEEEIMLRLPTKSLSRFSCVSKRWYNRITSSAFARKHLKCQRQSQSNNFNFNLMLHGSSGPLQSVSCSSSSSSSNYFDIDAKTITQHDQPLLVDFIDHEKHRFNVVGSCDGLLLVVASNGVNYYGGDHVFYIWNPTTGQYKTLPQLSSRIDGCIVLGFGPDLTTANNNHYKVLLLKTVIAKYYRQTSEDSDSETSEDSEPETSEFEVHIYTTHTDSWKTLPPNIGPYGYFTPHPQGMILAYNNLHYQAKIDTTEDDPSFYESILSFDLKDDKFRVLPMAPEILINLCALKGDLCAFTHPHNDFNLHCLWRMENFGVEKQECWTKMCSIDCRAGIDYPIIFISPLHFLEDGQILLYAQHDNSRPGQPFIIAYDTKNEKASFLLHGNGSFMSIPVVYEESFIPPNAASTAEEELTIQLTRRRTYMERCTRDTLSRTTI